MSMPNDWMDDLPQANEPGAYPPEPMDKDWVEVDGDYEAVRLEASWEENWTKLLQDDEMYLDWLASLDGLSHPSGKR